MLFDIFSRYTYGYTLFRGLPDPCELIDHTFSRSQAHTNPLPTPACRPYVKLYIRPTMHNRPKPPDAPKLGGIRHRIDFRYCRGRTSEKNSAAPSLCHALYIRVIASWSHREKCMRTVVGIRPVRKGKSVSQGNDPSPTVWFDSWRQLAGVLSDENRQLSALV